MKTITLWVLSKNVAELVELPGFVACWSYDHAVHPHPNEWGKIETKTHRFKICILPNLDQSDDDK